MTMFMMPHEREQIYRDTVDVLQGEDGHDCTIHYKAYSGTKDVYGNYTTETDLIIETRCLFAPMSQRADRAQEVKRGVDADIEVYDAAILISADIDLTGKESLYFELADIGNFVPSPKPPESSHFPIPLENRKFFREYLCKREG